MRVCDAAWAPVAESRHCTATARQPDEGQWPLPPPLALVLPWARRCIALPTGIFLLQRPAKEASPHCSRSQPRFGQRLADFSNYSVRCASVFSPVAGYSARGATCDSRDPKYPSMAATSTFQKMVTMMSRLSTRSSLTSSKHSMTSFWLFTLFLYPSCPIYYRT